MLTVAFEFNFIDDGSIGFNDPLLGTVRREAMNSAAIRFGSFFDHDTTLQVDVQNTSDDTSVGASANASFPLVPSTRIGFVSSVPEDKILQGIDSNGTESDGTIIVNWGGQTTFEFGLDVGFGEVDFLSVISHELTHLIGAMTGIGADGSDFFGSAVGVPSLWAQFDQFVSDGSGSRFINPATGVMDVASFTAQATAGTADNAGLFFSGPNAITANAGNPVPLHSPNPFEPGSSVAHLRMVPGKFTDETGLLNASVRDGGISRRWSAVEIGILSDLGYSVNALPTGFDFEESDGSTSVLETGTTDSFIVRLDVRPATDVVINLSSGNADAVTVSPSTLTFTPTNWATVQTVTVTGVNDQVADGDKTVPITMAINDDMSADNFDAVADQVVMVNVTGTSTPSITVTPDTDNQTPSRLTVRDTGTTESFSVLLNSRPETKVVLDVALENSTHASLSRTKLTFTPENFATPQTVSVTGTNDNVLNGDHTTRVVLMVNQNDSDDAFEALTISPIEVSILETQFDFGDAPATYAVTLADDGARHIATGPTLGNRRDVESDGQSSANAAGDDRPGAFGDARIVTSVGASLSNSIAVGDLNGDAIADLVTVASQPDALLVQLGIGDGTFETATQPNLGSGRGAVSVALADVNADLMMDIAVANNDSNNVSLLLGIGDGTFQTATTLDLGTNGSSFAAGLNQITAADINADGAADLLVVGALSNDVSVLLSNGVGGFTQAQRYVVFPSESGGGTLSLITANVDGDDVLDVVVSNRFSNELAVLRGVGDGTFGLATKNSIDSSGAGTARGPVTVAAGDFNGDSLVDLITANADFGNLTLLLGNGTSVFNAQDPIAIPGLTNLTTILAEDINNDGPLDTIVADSSASNGGVFVVFGNGDGTFQTPVHVSAGLVDGEMPFRLAVSDLDDNGSKEILTDLGPSVAVFEAAPSDEDGVVVVGTLTTGSNATLQVITSAAGKLDGWIDFGRDNSWNETSDQVFVSADVGAGENLLAFTVPADIAPGTVVARFRLSTAGSLTPTGLAPDGEVEDYVLTIRAASSGEPPELNVSPMGPNGELDPDDLPGTNAQPTTWAIQRSSLRVLTIGLPSAISGVTPADMVLTNLGVNADVDEDTTITLRGEQLSLLDGGTLLQLNLDAGQLTDGVYELDLLSDITGGDPFTITGDSTNRFYVLTGDWNGSGSVTPSDFATFAYWFGQDSNRAPSYVDLTPSASIGNSDFAPFASRFGTIIVFPAGSGARVRSSIVDALRVVDEVQAVEYASRVPDDVPLALDLLDRAESQIVVASEKHVTLVEASVQAEFVPPSSFVDRDSECPTDITTDFLPQGLFSEDNASLDQTIELLAGARREASR